MIIAKMPQAGMRQSLHLSFMLGADGSIMTDSSAYSAPNNTLLSIVDFHDMVTSDYL